MVKEDLAQALGGDLLLRERAAELERLDTFPVPDLGAEVLVLDLAEQGPVRHRSEPEEPGSVELSAIEDEKRRW